MSDVPYPVSFNTSIFTPRSRDDILRYTEEEEVRTTNVATLERFHHNMKVSIPSEGCSVATGIVRLGDYLKKRSRDEAIRSDLVVISVAPVLLLMATVFQGWLAGPRLTYETGKTM